MGMAIGSNACRMAEDTRLHGALEAGLDEALTALEEALYDLSDAQLAAFPIDGRNNIAWIGCHCLDNLDVYGVAFQTGQRVLPEDPRWGRWDAAPGTHPEPDDDDASVHDLMDLLDMVGAAAQLALAVADEDDLATRVTWNGVERMRSDSLVRTICHTNAHVRQIWLLRGALGLVDGASWPRQHWA